MEKETIEYLEKLKKFWFEPGNGDLLPELITELLPLLEKLKASEGKSE